jgi:predicted nucleic acid-binding protein
MRGGRNGSVKKKSVLDAYALLAYLKKESGHARVRDLLASEDASLFINSINAGEVFYIFAREHGIQAAEYFQSVILPSLPVGIVENSFDDVIQAARIKAKHSLSFADCFAAATAIREGASLLTGDPEFKKLGKDLSIEWLA